MRHRGCPGWRRACSTATACSRPGVISGRTPNHAWNLTDLPTRRGDGSLTRRPVAAIDLHYLITAYGDDGAHVDRPAVDALVAARTGHQWESRGVPGGTLARLADIPPAFPDLVVPDDCWVAAPRPGPLHSGVPWVSMASAYLATLAITFLISGHLYLALIHPVTSNALSGMTSGSVDREIMLAILEAQPQRGDDHLEDQVGAVAVADLLDERADRGDRLVEVAGDAAHAVVIVSFGPRRP